MDSGGLPLDWKPSPPTPIGSLRWKRETVERSFLSKMGHSNKAYNFADIGVLVIYYSGSGWNPFWVDRDNYHVSPDVDWENLQQQAFRQETPDYKV